jgi:hypothetical protein
MLRVRNVILRDHPKPLVSPLNVVSYSDVQGGFAGIGNIDADPLFVDAAGGDFALQPGSPCINTGDPALSPDPDGSFADMGAIAFHPWADLGFGLAGTLGEPLLAGSGPLTADSGNVLALSQAVPSVTAVLVVGLSPLVAPFHQVWLPDATSPAGFAASNALLATTP